jgi:RNA-binding protein
MLVHPHLALLVLSAFLRHGLIQVQSCAMIELTPIQRRALRASAHPLHPVVSISQNGLSETVLKEIDRSLTAHELIKVKLYGIERDARASLLAEICTSTNCAPVQQIGNTLVLWRPRPEEDEAPKTVRTKKPLTKKQAAAAQESGKMPTKIGQQKVPRRRTSTTGTTGITNAATTRKAPTSRKTPISGRTKRTTRT